VAQWPTTSDGDSPVALIMTTPAVTAPPTLTVAAARRLMERSRIRHLPVVEAGLLVGIVSERDLRGAPGEAVPLREIMRSPVFVLSPDTSIRHAARVFRQRKIGAMPVLEGREVVGMVSVVDVLRILSE
jgi:acetoin utilization protein AcuB